MPKQANTLLAKKGPLLYSIAKAAERLGAAASWLRSESSAGRAQYRLIGRHRMFSEEDLEQIVKDAHRPSSGRSRHGNADVSATEAGGGSHPRIDCAQRRYWA
ncbi:hypothetical protein [Streptomyces sp. NPDC052494]|uniref:hypothetical protein n=1 Tax=Streptomyces sp. NPDC052494 TaxID=3365692 RepID=UPI0037D172D4